MIYSGAYKHFKGGHYRVLDIALDSETKERIVVYVLLADPLSKWVRSEKNFEEVVEWPDGTGNHPRFVREDF